MNYKSFLTTLLILLSLGSTAQEQKDTAFANLYRRYFQLYTDSDETAFFEASEQLKEYYLKHGNNDSYYKVFLNEVLYDTEHGKTYRAIKKANSLLLEMEQKNEKHYEIVYSALGNIYDMRGNYRMSNKYYQDALKACSPTDTGALVGIYSRIAALQAHREPLKAWEVNEQLGKLTTKMPQYYKVYVVLKAEIAFYLKDKKRYEQAQRQYELVCKKHPLLDVYGKDMMDMVGAAFSGDYDAALNVLSHKSTDFEALDRCDMRIAIYEMMGNRQMALNEVERRRDLRDSLNSDMLFESINEINAEMGMMKVEEQARIDQLRANRKQKWLMAVVIVLLMAGLGLVFSRNLMRRRLQKQLIKKNKELEIALSRAEESDRMKDSFIRHVSHEIRTPLNVITGYAQIITNPAYKLKEEERNHMLSDIGKNTNDITEIVNQLLEIAQDESREHYPKEDQIAINSFCRTLMEQAEKTNHGRLKMMVTTEVDDDCTFMSNRQALEKIISQLLNNAMKFTHNGFVELKVEQHADQGTIRFIVTDSGIGIAQEHQSRIFERFFKVDEFQHGFGLGLTMSQKMATLLGGSLSLDKAYTDGARFILTLPA